MAKSTRLTKRQLKEDQFVTSAFQAADFFQEHKKPIFMGLAGVVLGVAAVFFFMHSQASGAKAAAAMLGQGTGLFTSGNYPEAAIQLSRFLDEHPRSPSAGYAAVLAGDSYYYSGRPSDAAQKYRYAIERAKDGSDVKRSATAGLAAVDESEGKFTEAARTYEELAASEKTEAGKARMLYAAGRCYLSGNEFQKASEIFANIDRDLIDPIQAATLDWFEKEAEIGLAGS